MNMTATPIILSSIICVHPHLPPSSFQSCPNGSFSPLPSHLCVSSIFTGQWLPVISSVNQFSPFWWLLIPSHPLPDPYARKVTKIDRMHYKRHWSPCPRHRKIRDNRLRLVERGSGPCPVLSGTFLLPGWPGHQLEAGEGDSVLLCSVTVNPVWRRKFFNFKRQDS